MVETGADQPENNKVFVTIGKQESPTCPEGVAARFNVKMGECAVAGRTRPGSNAAHLMRITCKEHGSCLLGREDVAEGVEELEAQFQRNKVFLRCLYESGDTG